MSTSRILLWLTAWVAVLTMATEARAQNFRPFHFPSIESDFQFFAPADIDDFGGGPNYRTGWYATYDRMYINVSRPENSPIESRTDGDFTWGNRWDLGFVDDDRNGWGATFMHVDGPNAESVIRTERINRFNANMPPINPEQDDNNYLTGARDYLLSNSINSANLTSFELNRSWGWKPLHNGALITPITGFRYMQFNDFTIRQQYFRFDAAGNPIPPGPPGTGAGGTNTALIEQLNTVGSSFANDLVGGQLGFRWETDYRRWHFYGDVKAFALQNFQNFHQQIDNVFTQYNAALGPNVVAVETSRTHSNANGSEFVWGMELRAEAAYEVTRDVSLRVGFEMLEFAQGIGRGPAANANEEDLTMFGVTFGVTVNR